MSVLGPQFADQWWRLNNLYWIIDADGMEIPFVPNEVQKKFYFSRAYRNLILKARQRGFSTFIQLLALDHCVFTKNFSAAVIAHTKDDAARIFRDKIKFAYERLPAEIRAAVGTNKNESGELLLTNGSGIRVTVSTRSSTMQFLHVSELGKIAAKYPNKAREILTGSLPSVHVGGWVFVESTAEGKEGAFFDLCQDARKRAEQGGKLTALDFRFHFAPWFGGSDNLLHEAVVIPERLASYFLAVENQCGVTLRDEEQWWYVATERVLGADMKREHPSTPDEAFEQSIEGAYWATAITDCYTGGRVGEYPIDPALPVHTSWDIGVSDQTTIWLYQVQQGAPVFLKYLEHSGEGLGYYIDLLRKTGWRFGRFFAPHDMAVREWGSGRSRMEMAREEHGVSFEIVAALSLADGIEAVRAMLPRSRFDEAGCELGLKRASGYRKDWNEKMGVWRDQPRHDLNSHGADSLRVAALSEVTMVAAASAGEYLAGEPVIAVNLVDRGAKRAIR